MLECPKTAQMKDFLKLFKTIMDFKGLFFIVTEQPFNKKLRPVFYFATVTRPISSRWRVGRGSNAVGQG